MIPTTKLVDFFLTLCRQALVVRSSGAVPNLQCVFPRFIISFLMLYPLQMNPTREEIARARLRRFAMILDPSRQAADDQQAADESQQAADESQVAAATSQLAAPPSQVLAAPSHLAAPPSQVVPAPSQLLAAPSQLLAAPSVSRAEFEALKVLLETHIEQGPKQADLQAMGAKIDSLLNCKYTSFVDRTSFILFMLNHVLLRNSCFHYHSSKRLLCILPGLSEQVLTAVGGEGGAGPQAGASTTALAVGE